MKTCGIYTITNLINDKIYIGQSTYVEDRMRLHKRLLKQGIHKNEHLQSAFTIHGIDNFSFELLEECEEQFLYSQEHFWVNILLTSDKKYGYNMKLTHPEGKTRHSEEIKQKMRKKKCFILTDELRKKWSDAQKGRVKSEQERKNISNAKKGKQLPRKTLEAAWAANRGKSKEQPEEVRKKISEKLKGRKFTEEHKQKLRKPKRKDGNSSI